MKKGTKKIIGAIIALLLIIAVIWLIYESVKPEPVSIAASNELPNENMGLDNIINDLFENVVTNTAETNETTNEVVNEVNEVEEEPAKENAEDSNESEIVSGTTTSREERAVEIAKEYYEKEYGSPDEVYFTYDSIYEDGRYIVRAGNAETGVKTLYLLVNLNTGEVTERQ